MVIKNQTKWVIFRCFSIQVTMKSPGRPSEILMKSKKIETWNLRNPMNSPSNPMEIPSFYHVSIIFPAFFGYWGGFHAQPLQRPPRRLRRVVGQRPGRGRLVRPPTAKGDDHQSAPGAAGGAAIIGRGAPEPVENKTWGMDGWIWMDLDLWFMGILWELWILDGWISDLWFFMASPYE